jgi:hypothetical protein
LHTVIRTLAGVDGYGDVTRDVLDVCREIAGRPVVEVAAEAGVKIDKSWEPSMLFGLLDPAIFPADRQENIDE